MRLSGWGRFPVQDARVFAPRDEQALISHIGAGHAIARGNGRSYGDSAVSQSNTVHMRFFNRMLAFDSTNGLLVAEAGVLLADVIDTFLPSGWFPAVTPGTKFVTLGGMVAADVHGKNHHKEGSFGRYVEWLELMDQSGSILRCSRDQNAEVFDWTVGGMGLTGVIVRVAIRLKQVESAWIKQQTIPTTNLQHTMEVFEAAQESTYSVAWIDCLGTQSSSGRCLVYLGEHATIAELSKRQQKAPFEVRRKKGITMPFDFPSWTLNQYAVKAFNAAYYKNGLRNQGERIVDWDGFFYPLDSILGWNRIYGRRGFLQFQCVLPIDRSEKGLKELLAEISTTGIGSFLAVLKRFGEQYSKFSFPMLGYTLALDFPVSERSLALMQRLDKIAASHGGRFYLAKDGRIAAETIRQSDSRSDAFIAMRTEQQLREGFQSSQSERLGL